MSDVGNFDDSSSDRLEGTRSMVGGLILKGNNKKTSQAPKESVLGLQKLAEEKRKRKLEEDGEKPKRLKDLSKNRETGDWEDTNDDDLDGRARLSSGIRNKDFKSKSRHYRAGLVETPSHTGGVNEEIREKQLRRLERDRGTRRGGVYAESKIKDRDDKDSRNNRDKNDSCSDREKKRYDEGERSSRRSQDYRDDRDNYFKEPRSRRGEWEETPYRSSRSSRNEGYNTPRHKSKGTHTCNIYYFAMKIFFILHACTHQFETLTSPGWIGLFKLWPPGPKSYSNACECMLSFLHFQTEINK